MSAIYFSFVTIATVGYGDIAPKSTLAQFTVVSEIMVGLYLLAVILGIVARWVPRSAGATKPAQSEQER